MLKTVKKEPKKKSHLSKIFKLAAIGAGAAAAYYILKKKKEKENQTVVVADVENNKIVVNGKEYPLNSEEIGTHPANNAAAGNPEEESNEASDEDKSEISDDIEIFNELDKIKENIDEFENKLPSD